jgi:hypothetical protein
MKLPVPIVFNNTKTAVPFFKYKAEGVSLSGGRYDRAHGIRGVDGRGIVDHEF